MTVASYGFIILFNHSVLACFIVCLHEHSVQKKLKLHMHLCFSAIYYTCVVDIEHADIFVTKRVLWYKLVSYMRFSTIRCCHKH